MQHASKCLLLLSFSLTFSLSHARTRVSCVFVCMYGFSNSWIEITLLPELSLSIYRPFLQQFHNSHGLEIRAIGFVSNQGGNRVWFLGNCLIRCTSRHIRPRLGSYFTATRTSPAFWIIFMKRECARARPDKIFYFPKISHAKTNESSFGEPTDGIYKEKICK